MSMSEFVRSQTSCGLKFRWFTCNCTEIKLPNGKTILIDPFLPPDSEAQWQKMGMACGYSVADLEGADYVIINHSHGDHIEQLGEVYERFHPRVLCHTSTAMSISQAFHVAERDIFPFSSHDTYQFGDFTLETSEGRHNQTPKWLTFDHVTDVTSMDYINMMGSLFNTNFVITTNDGLRLAFSAGEWDNVCRDRWRNMHPNVLFRHRTNWQMAPREMAEVIAEIGTQICVPWHHNNAYDPSFDYDFNAFTAKVNEELAAMGSICRFINPERGKWYQVTLAVSACD